MSKKNKSYLNLEKWEINCLDLFDPQENNQMYYYYKFMVNGLKKNSQGDIAELGVYRGKSLITTALLIKKFKSNKKVWGYDTFSGFPKKKENKIDKFSNFKKLYLKKKISKSHYEKTLKLKKHLFFLKKKRNIFNLSTSGNFSKTSLNFVRNKSIYLNCNEKIKFIKGKFDVSLNFEKNLPKKIFCGLIDCDLFEGYNLSLDNFFPRLIKNGKLFLDEYYSLKFPGPRISVENFLKKNKEGRLVLEGVTGGFERWSIQKK